MAPLSEERSLMLILRQGRLPTPSGSSSRSEVVFRPAALKRRRRKHATLDHAPRDIHFGGTDRDKVD